MQGDCERVQEELLFFLDEEGSGEDTLRIAEHLKQCPSCRERIERIPASMIIKAITHAKMGRSIKKRAIAMPYCACVSEITLVVTGAPGRIFCNPSTINLSPTAKPEVTRHWLLITSAVVTVFDSTTPWPFTTIATA